MITGADVVAAARGHIGTPWVHQGRLPGQALDCAGLVICVGQQLGLVPAAWDRTDYTRQPDGTLGSMCDAHLQRIPALELGAVLLLAVERDPQHLAIVGDYRHGGWSIIHASSTARPGRVIETRLMFGRGLVLQAAYRYKGLA